MDRWSGVSQAYRRSFAGLCAGMIEPVLDALPRGRLLDVGCGTGELLAAALGRGWDASGMDADPDMVHIAQDVAAGRVTCAALPDLPLPDGSFDAVAANFVLNHVGDPRATLRELGRVTRAGGVLAVTVGPAAGAGWNALVAPAFQAAGAGPMPSSHVPAHLDFPRTCDGVEALVNETGWMARSAREVTWSWRVRAEDLWAGISGGVATVGETFLAQSPAARRRIEQEFLRRAPDFEEDGQLSFTNRAVFVCAGRSEQDLRRNPTGSGHSQSMRGAGTRSAPAVSR